MTSESGALTDPATLRERLVEARQAREEFPERSPTVVYCFDCDEITVDEQTDCELYHDTVTEAWDNSSISEWINCIDYLTDYAQGVVVEYHVYEVQREQVGDALGCEFVPRSIHGSQDAAEVAAEEFGSWAYGDDLDVGEVLPDAVIYPVDRDATARPSGATVEVPIQYE